MADKAQDEPQIPPGTLGTVLPAVRGAQQLTAAGSLSGFLCGPLRNHASWQRSTRYLESRAPEAFPWVGTQEPGVCRERAWGWPRSHAAAHHAATSRPAPGRPSRWLCLLPASSHECYLHGKCEPWKGSKGRGHHCSGFRPGIWGPRPAWPFSWRPQVLGQPFRSLDTTNHLSRLGHGPWGVPGLACPPIPFQMLLPDASEQLSCLCPSLPNSTPSEGREGGRGREGCHRFLCVRGQDLRNDSGPF